MRRNISALNLLILLLASCTALGGQSTSEKKPAKPKRVFTNEDLGKIREKYGTESNSTPAAPPIQPGDSSEPSVQAGTPAKAASPESKAYWMAKLKETDSALEKAKAQELKFYGIVEKYELKLRDAKGDFHTRTSQEQLADSMKNLSRAKDEVKQGQEAKAKLLAEAAEKGFKPSDLIEESPR